MSKRKTLTLAQLTENSNKLWVALAQLEAKQGGRFKAVEESNGRLSRIMEAQDKRLEALEARARKQDEDREAILRAWPTGKPERPLGDGQPWRDEDAKKNEPPKCSKCGKPAVYSKSEGGWVCGDNKCDELHVDAPAPALREQMVKALKAFKFGKVTPWEEIAEICARVAEEGK